MHTFWNFFFFFFENRSQFGSVRNEPIKPETEPKKILIGSVLSPTVVGFGLFLSSPDILQ